MAGRTRWHRARCWPWRWTQWPGRTGPGWRGCPTTSTPECHARQPPGPAFRETLQLVTGKPYYRYLGNLTYVGWEHRRPSSLPGTQAWPSLATVPSPGILPVQRQHLTVPPQSAVSAITTHFVPSDVSNERSSSRRMRWSWAIWGFIAGKVLGETAAEVVVPACDPVAQVRDPRFI